MTSRGTPGRAREVGQAFAAHEPRPGDPGLVLASWVKGLGHGRSKDTPATLSESTMGVQGATRKMAAVVNPYAWEINDFTDGYHAVEPG